MKRRPVIHPIRLASFALSLILGLALAPKARAEGDYIIVCPAHLKPVAQAFAKYRSRQSLRCQTLSLETLVTPSMARAERVKAIQAAIRKGFQKRGQGPKYVLILGDVDSRRSDPKKLDRVPCGYVKDDSEQTRQVGRKDDTIATDNAYALKDDKDQLPDYAVGRLSIRSVAQGLSMLRKIKSYEQRQQLGAWRRRLSFFASEGRFGVGDRLLEWLFAQLADEYIPYDFDLKMTYANPDSPFVTLPRRFSQTVLKQTNEGSLILNYIGHGQDRSLDTLRWKGQRYPILDRRQLKKINVQGKYPIFFIVACFTGRYDRLDDKDCIAEDLLKNEQGPVAVFAASRISHPYTNAVLQKDFLDQVCRQRVKTLGEAVRLAKVAMVKNFDASRKRLELMSALIVPKPERRRLEQTHLAMYNLFGDPALRIQSPPSYTLKWQRSAARPLTWNLPKSAQGHALVTLECQRSRFLYDVKRGLSEGLKEEDLVENYRRANWKIFRHWRVPVRDGQLCFESAPDWTFPKKHGRFYVKVYAQGRDRGQAFEAMASLEVPKSWARAIPTAPQLKTLKAPKRGRARLY